jgi:hypothetical protein
MKKLFIATLAIIITLAMPSLCRAQKCRTLISGTAIFFSSPDLAYRWIKISSTDKETGDNYLDRLNDTGHVGGLKIRRQIYTINKIDFTLYSANDLPIYQIADFKTKRPIGWIMGYDLKLLKSCK